MRPLLNRLVQLALGRGHFLLHRADFGGHGADLVLGGRRHLFDFGREFLFGLLVGAFGFGGQLRAQLLGVLEGIGLGLPGGHGGLPARGFQFFLQPLQVAAAGLRRHGRRLLDVGDFVQQRLAHGGHFRLHRVQLQEQVDVGCQQRNDDAEQNGNLEPGAFRRGVGITHGQLPPRTLDVFLVYLIHGDGRRRQAKGFSGPCEFPVCSLENAVERRSWGAWRQDGCLRWVGQCS
jgi:hypothetical protein